MRSTSILLAGIPVGLCLAMASTGYSGVNQAESWSATAIPVSSDQINKSGAPGVTETVQTAVNKTLALLADGDSSTGAMVYGSTTSVTYDFATPVTINSIETFTMNADAAHIDQNYRVGYYAGNNTYVNLATVAYAPGKAGATKVSITDSSGTLASGVTSVIFVFIDQDGWGGGAGSSSTKPQGGYVPYTELSINAVPEPTFLSLLPLRKMDLLGRRRAAKPA